MKKILIVLSVLIVTSIGCKKVNHDGQLCGCSPMRGPELFLSVKNADGIDLLNEANAGAYSKSDVQVYQKNTSGQAAPLQFAIRPPFDYGDKKFMAYSIYLPISFANQSADNTAYLKLRNKEYKLKVQLARTGEDVTSLLIDDKPAAKDNTDLANYLPMFYLTE